MRLLLITGADGWLGQAIIDQLVSNKEFNEGFDHVILHALDASINRSRYPLIIEDTTVGWIFGDLKDKEFFYRLDLALRNINATSVSVITTAAVIHPKKKSDFRDVNEQGLKNLYTTCMSSGVLHKFVYISSNSPFGFNKPGFPFDEGSRYSPFGGYGKSKVSAERYLLSQSNKDIVILRPPWFHGSNMPERQKKFLLSASKGMFPIVGRGSNIRSVVNVKDLAIASLITTIYPTRYSIYWISGDSLSMREMVRIIKDLSGSRNSRKMQIRLPYGFSSLLFLFDMILQGAGIYNMYVHVLSEIGQNIECTSLRYLEEFGHIHRFTSFANSISDELEEALDQGVRT